MTTDVDQDKFDAAVKIITGLPKDGPFQPSNDMKLKFYAYYKQATLGPCTSPQPGFWDVINRTKWNAWKALGDMPKIEAMHNYVDLLKQVVETMTLDANVQDFLEKTGPMYEFVTDDGRVVSKSADFDSSRLDMVAMEKLGLRISNGNRRLLNGEKSLESRKAVNGKGASNGFDNGHAVKSSLEESDSEDEPEIRLNGANGPAVHVSAIRKADLEAPSDEDEFDDARDSQAFTSVAIDIAPVVSSGSHSPLSSGSTPPPLSKTVQSNDGSLKHSEKRSISRPVVATSGPDALVNPSSFRHRAATALGQLLRQLPEMDDNKRDGTDNIIPDNRLTNVTSEDSIIRAWAVLRRIHAENVRQAHDDDDWLIRRLRHLKRGRSSQRKHRGRGGNEDGRSTGGNNPVDGENSAGRSVQSRNVGISTESSSIQRSQRQLSGESATSSSSSGADSLNLEFDPHVGAVLLRMHRELQHINRQLELVEGILITQQQMIRNLVAGADQSQKKMRLGFFSNLPWRTIGFIFAWPIVVNILLRLWIYKIRRRR